MRIRDIFFRNFWWKLASVALATLIWINYVYPTDRLKFSTNSRSLIELTVVPVANLGDVRDFKTSPTIVNVRLEGQPRDMRRVNPADVHARVFVPNPAKANGASLPVEISGLPPGVSVIDITPEEVTIQAPTSRGGIPAL